MLDRFRLRLAERLGFGDRLNDRSRVESWLHDCANGKRPLPTREECREWAVILGVPKAYRRK